MVNSFAEYCGSEISEATILFHWFVDPKWLSFRALASTFSDLSCVFSGRQWSEWLAIACQFTTRNL